MNKSKRSGSYVINTVIASVVLSYAVRLSASGRTAIDWIVMALVVCVMLYNLAQLTRSLYRSGGAKDAWHLQRTALFWVVGLLNTLLLRPEHVGGWRQWVGVLFLVAAMGDTVALFVKERGTRSENRELSSGDSEMPS